MNEERVHLGRRGEEVAARHLEAEGWSLLDRNWRDGPRELDLVARRGSTLAFVEVKTRREPAWNDPLESLDWRKRREVERAAKAWLRARAAEAARAPGSAGPVNSIRFDVVVVRLPTQGAPRVEHLPDAWRPGWDRSAGGR